MGGAGGGIARTHEELVLHRHRQGLELSPADEVLVEESIEGWKEYEMEVMRDAGRQRHHRLLHREPRPHGRAHRRLHHRGAGPDLTDLEYQRMRDASLAIFEKIGVETGGSNVQFAVHPETGRMIVIEMNPRVIAFLRAGLQGHGFSHR